MGCKGCPENPKNINRDRNGNIVGTESEMDSMEREVRERAETSHNKEITYEEFLSERAAHKKSLKERGKQIVDSLPNDIKRIRIDELVSIYNHDEVGQVSPTQALVALWELLQMPPYKVIIDEFEGLETQIVEKYESLMKNKIKINWKKSLH